MSTFHTDRHGLTHLETQMAPVLSTSLRWNRCQITRAQGDLKDWPLRKVHIKTDVNVVHDHALACFLVAGIELEGNVAPPEQFSVGSSLTDTIL